MEFHVLATSVLRGVDLYKSTRLSETFLNVSGQENYHFYICILLFKCFAAAHGMKKIPGTATFTMLLVNFIKSCICAIGVYRVLLSVVHFVGVAAALPLFYEEEFYSLPNGIVLAVACFYNSFEFFVDVYLVVLFFTYIFELFDKEIEKCVTLISYLYCLDWVTDYLLGGGNIGMIHAFLVLHLPLFLLTAFSPNSSNPRALYSFIYLAVGITLWQVCRLAKAGIQYGVTSNPFFLSNETLDAIKWSTESLRDISVLNVFMSNISVSNVSVSNISVPSEL